MKLLKLLVKIFVTPFYKKNAGFFLFFFFLFFGTVSPDSIVLYHLSLIQSILSSYVTLAGVLILWLLYNFKCSSHIYKSIKNKEGEYLYLLQELPFRKQIQLFITIELLLFAPILLYILVIISRAIHDEKVIKAGILVSFALLTCIGSAYNFCRIINNTYISNKSISFLENSIQKQSKKFIYLLLYFSILKKKKLLAALKLLSLMIFYIALVWNGDRYDHDSLVLFLLIILLTHAVIAFQYVQFIERALVFIRNLPVSTFRIFALYYLASILLFVPELIYLIITGHVLISVLQIIAIYFSLVHTFLFFTTVQYSGAIDKNEYVKIIAGAGFVSIFFFNSGQYLWWSVLTLLIAGLIFFTSYGDYELLPESEIISSS
jgi:hypothetical protein